jgi:hypothetical protein
VHGWTSSLLLDGRVWLWLRTSLALHALELMAAHSQDTMNCTNTPAESVGNPWRDEAQERRSRAAREPALHS